ncbi:MAG: DUF971 domain-containing protein [Holophagales bacterium]|nr:DUF971 domain-containing protein [Holophagales bacterium]
MDYPSTGTSLVEFRRLPEAKAVALAWDDGASARMSYDLLQGYCPCAQCRGHHAGEITYQTPSRPIRGLEVAPVGNYAVSLAFEGGCNSGIFHFDFLREVCRREDLLATP